MSCELDEVEIAYRSRLPCSFVSSTHENVPHQVAPRSLWEGLKLKSWSVAASRLGDSADDMPNFLQKRGNWGFHDIDDAVIKVQFGERTIVPLEERLWWAVRTARVQDKFASTDDGTIAIAIATWLANGLQVSHGHLCGRSLCITSW